jgi:hypothetical protein
MFSRLTISCVIGTLAALTLVMACGDDSGSGSEEESGSGGSSAGRSGSSSTAGVGGSGTAGTSGRGAGRGMMGGGQQMCQAGKPTLGSACTPASGNCRYGSEMCDCAADTSAWICWALADCPTSLPAEMSSCDTVGMACTVATDDCSCTATGWNCGHQYCPPAEPALGSECQNGDGTCPYGGRTCECASSMWSCWSPSDCPATVPERSAMCTIPGIVCPYEGGDCTCQNNNSWRCGRGVMRPMPPEDAGI